MDITRAIEHLESGLVLDDKAAKALGLGPVSGMLGDLQKRFPARLATFHTMGPNGHTVRLVREERHPMATRL